MSSQIGVRLVSRVVSPCTGLYDTTPELLIQLIMAKTVDRIHRDTTTLLGATQVKLEDLLREGHTFRTACAKAGVSYYTFHDWMMKGGDPGSRAFHKCPDTLRVEPYYSFARAMRAAEADGRRVERPRMPTGPAPTPITDAQREQIMRGFASGWTIRRIARTAGVTHNTLLSWLYRGGYPKQVSHHVPIDPAGITEPYRSFVEDVLRAEDAFFTGEW